ncbi:hypothetical protein ASG84_25485 [Rhodococcus sp. Leaf278]|uniref:hypothetical protein n=1 Tax=Rhodococcus sp. Leaf278 TaxID=1736319 RepID=UPI000710C74E|nr:hypothetical protein [Rhodococcus sp. Leaf278]KQU52183.1 hypothetical protein ASG84_25485 [Rhodococcus sp. Leaf278]
MSAPERAGQRFLLSPEKRRGALPGIDPRVERAKEQQRAQDVRDAARLATLWMRDAIRAIEDLDYVDRVGFLSEGADRLDAVAAELNQRIVRLQSNLRLVLESAAPPPHLGTLQGRECSKQGSVDPLVVAALASAANTAHEMPPMERGESARRKIFEVTQHVNQALGHLSGNDALRATFDVPKPGQHLKSRPSGKPAGPSDRHGGALNPTAAPDGSGPGGGG